MGLVHDIGHPAFAHAGEAGIPGGHHEGVSVYAIQNVLGELFDETFFEGATALLVSLMTKPVPELTFLRQLVAGEMDADRADYLLRDSWHCGVRYGVFDFDRLLESLTLIDDPDSGQLSVALDRGGEHTFEAMILARYQMSTQVYFHKIRRIYDHYLAEYNRHWGPENYRNMEDVLRHDDLSVYQEIRRDAGGPGPRESWASRIVNRQHHRVAYETGDNADWSDVAATRRLLGSLQRQFPETEFYFDDLPLGVYKLSIPGDQEEEKVENLYIREHNGKLTLLAHESAIISKVPKSVRTVRIFAAAEGGVLDEIRMAGRQIERNS
jgi:uncharacterized protein